MIDNYRKAMVLVAKMNAALPIPARPSRSLVDLLMQRGVTLDADSWLQIRNVIYRGGSWHYYDSLAAAPVRKLSLPVTRFSYFRFRVRLWVGAPMPKL